MISIKIDVVRHMETPIVKDSQYELGCVWCNWFWGSGNNGTEKSKRFATDEDLYLRLESRRRKIKKKKLMNM